jgi:hypothetical protein
MATKSRGIGRGGSRGGAGRKAKPREPVTKAGKPPAMPKFDYVGLSRREIAERVLLRMASG